MKYLKDFGFKNQRVLLRADFNVPVVNNQVTNDFRIRAVLPTIKYLIDNKAKIIILTHFGRPNGQVVEKLRVDLIGQKLAALLKQPVKKLNDCLGPAVAREIERMQPAEIILLENIQFQPGERNNDPSFAQGLAKLADFFVLDAFGQAHRNYASIIGLPKYLPSCAGFLLAKEVAVLKKVLDKPERPLVVIIGGAKMATKTGMIKQFLKTADDIILGGALANTVLWAEGIAIGKSVVEKDLLPKLEEIDLTNSKLHMPVDAVASTTSDGQAPTRITPIAKTKPDEMILDIGPDTVSLYSQIIKSAKMILWNGPMGLFEVESFANGSQQIAQAVAKAKAFKVIGGGDTISCLSATKFLDKVDHVSTGGGAMLAYLGQGTLPGLAALERKQ